MHWFSMHLHMAAISETLNAFTHAQATQHDALSWRVCGPAMACIAVACGPVHAMPRPHAAVYQEPCC
jgi:hypothetical protein